MIFFLSLFFLQQISIFANNKSVIFIGPVHIIENQNGNFSCSWNTKENFQSLEVYLFNNEILSWANLQEKCAISKDYRKYVSYCIVENGILNFTMMFIPQFEGIFTCQITSIKGERLESKINTFVNATSPIFNGTIKDEYNDNETLNFSCQSVNNKTNLLIINYLIYGNGEMVNLAQMNTTFSSITSISINLNKTMNEGFLGCGIQYEYSRYNENFIKLNILYEIEKIEIDLYKEIYYRNDIIRCFANGNPSPNVEWNLNNPPNNYDDVINQSSLIIGNLLGNRTYKCIAKQTFRNKTITLTKEFIFIVQMFQTTITPTPKWTNIIINFTGDQFFKSNISEHRWEIFPKWVGFINGTITANDSEIISFNNTNIFKYPEYIYDINITISSLFYRLTESAIYGEYRCKMINQYQETIEKAIFFIKGENPKITLIRDGNKFIINCSTTTLGLPPGNLRLFKRDLENRLDKFAPTNYSKLYIIKEIDFNYSVNKHVIFCVNKNEFYSWESDKLIINITFPVRDIKLSPNLDEYKYGDTVKCDAIGNPDPNITWWSNVNGSYIKGSSSNIITLTPPSISNVIYACTASNIIENTTNVITKTIKINKSFEEFVYFTVVPNVVGLVEYVFVNCTVENMNKVSLMNIKDNNNIMASIESNSFQITKEYRNKIYNMTINKQSVIFALDLLNASPGILSCNVLYLSNNRTEKRIELKNAIEIEYLTRTPIVGKIFQFSCLQNYQNASIMKAGISLEKENITLKTMENVKIGEIRLIDVEIESRFINNSFFCSLISNNNTMKTVIGNTLIERFGLWEIFMSPNLTKYEIGMTVKCEATGNPLPDISWSSNVNNSFSVVSFPDVIILNANANSDLIYTCKAINSLNNFTNTLNKSINIYGKYEEFINFEIFPKVVGLLENVSVMCEVDKLESVSVMNIKDNDNIMISISSETVSVDLNYRNKISKLNRTSKSIKFEIDLSKESPRNMSCFVIFVSNNRTEKRFELKNAIEIEYLTRTPIVGETFQFSCLQNYQNASIMKAGISLGKENITLKTMENAKIGEKKFIDVEIESRFINNSFFCSLISNNNTMKTVIGNTLIERFGLWEIFISPNLTKYEIGMTVKCEATGNPLPDISWSSNVNNSFSVVSFPDVIILNANANSDLIYTCKAINSLNNFTNTLNKSINIYGKYEEFINFEIFPKVVGLLENVSVMCEVDKLESVSVMNIKDNDNIMISISSETVSVDLNYRNKISKLNRTSKSIKFEIDLSKESPRNMSCFVIFVSNNRTEKRFELKNAIEIEYLTRTPIVSKTFQFSCLQNYQNASIMKAGISLGKENITLKTMENVKIGEIRLIDVEIESRFINNSFFCSLISNNNTIKTVIGNTLILNSVSKLAYSTIITISAILSILFY